MHPSISRSVTPNITSHSLRRGAAAYPNASPKLAIQWISTRGAWHLDSFTKAFAYIGTATKEDQSVAKVLVGYQAPDLPVTTPTIRDLQQRLSALEFGQLITLRDELYRHVLGFDDARFNVAVEVVDATLASLLMHLEATLATTSSITTVSRYLYEIQRGIKATNVRLGSCITISTCWEWGSHLKAHRQATNHAQLSSAVAGRDTLLSSTLENILNQLMAINERLRRLEDVQAQRLASAPNLSLVHTHQPAAVAPAVPPPATASTLAGCLLNWYTNHIWQTVNGKKEQNKRTEAKAAVNIMMILCQKAFKISQEPSCSDAADVAPYRSWKDSLWTLAVAMDNAANERLYSFDNKKPT
ncbi:hypothetical protein PI125_g12250 [Phytophthora idaei]|nr:hypothetical protein PI125_g12250 [Phytophthora idaei]